MTEVREFVAMEDGVRLAISRFEPTDGGGPWPVILEALPYRKDDLTASYRVEYGRLVDEGHYVVRARRRARHRLVGGDRDRRVPAAGATRPRAAHRVVRGAAVVDRQRVGMYGTSYSGFNSLQVAAERPPELGAVCAIYSNDDRYTDDVHYAGGVLRAVDLVDYVVVHGRDDRAAAGARGVRRRLARRVAAAGRRHRAVAAALVRRADRR